MKIQLRHQFTAVIRGPYGEKYDHYTDGWIVADKSVNADRVTITLENSSNVLYTGSQNAYNAMLERGYISETVTSPWDNLE